jgi:hypothetical protein
MKTTYRVKLTPHPIIIRQVDETQEIIFDKKHLKISTAERIVSDLNKGIAINWDDLN